MFPNTDSSTPQKQPQTTVNLVDWVLTHLDFYTDLFGARYGHKFHSGTWRAQNDPDPRADRLRRLILHMLDVEALAGHSESRVA
jgi:hypothetical protein